MATFGLSIKPGLIEKFFLQEQGAEEYCLQTVSRFHHNSAGGYFMTGRRILVSVAVVLISSAVGLNAQDKDLAWAVSQAPADSLVVAGVPNLQGLWDNLRELTGQGEKMPDLLAAAEKSIPAGVDLKGATVAILMAVPGDKGPDVLVMSRLKADGTLNGEKLEGGIIKVAAEANGSDVYVFKMLPWVAMSDSLDSLKAFVAATTRLKMTAQQKTDLTSRSMWAWVNTKALTVKAKAAMAKNRPSDGASTQGPNPAMLADWAVGLLSQTDSLTAALDAKPEAVSLAVGLEYAPGSQLGLLAASGMPVASYKTGLPATDRMLFACWGRMDWIKAIGPTKAVLRPLLDAIVPPSNAEARKSLDDLWAIYDEWAANLGNGISLVMEPAPDGEGMYRLAEVISVKNPDAYRKLIAKTMPLSANLTKAFSGLGPTRGPAMEIKTDYKPAAETIEGVVVDVNKTRMVFKTSPDMPPYEQEAAQKMLDSMYGPEGMTMRMAVIDRNVVASLGGKDAMAGAIKASKGQAPDLAGNPKVAAALARVPKDATFTGLISLPTYAHLTFSMVQRMTAGAAANPQPPPALGDLVTFSLRTRGATQYFDLNVPQSEIRGMIAVFDQLTAKMKGGSRTPMRGGEPKKRAPASDDSAAPPGSK